MTHGAILLLLQLCNSSPHRYANFQFCSFMCDYSSDNVLTPHISKTHLPIAPSPLSLNTLEEVPPPALGYDSKK